MIISGVRPVSTLPAGTGSAGQHDMLHHPMQHILTQAGRCYLQVGMMRYTSNCRPDFVVPGGEKDDCERETVQLLTGNRAADG